MGRSFFNDKDSDLYISSNTFSTLITATPTVYGLTAGQATAYATLNTAWRSAYIAANTPATRTEVTVEAKNVARAPLVVMASDLGQIVQGTATVTADQKRALGLSVRETPTPVAPPGTPFMFSLKLPGNGDVKLGWKCENPLGAQGTMYNVFRKIDAETEYKFVGGVGEKKFTDTTLPAGAVNVTYKVQAVRSTAAGDWGTFDVDFGKNAAGATVATVFEQPAKRAA